MNRSRWANLWTLEDWWAVWFGAILIFVSTVGAVSSVPRLEAWTWNPLGAFAGRLLVPVLLLGAGIALLTACGMASMSVAPAKQYLKGFAFVFGLALVAFTLSEQTFVNQYGLGYALWAIVLGLTISNVFGTPDWVLEGARMEMFIKTGLVLLGAEILFSQIMELGGPGLFVAWGVTPVVVIFMYWLGVHGLKMPSKALVVTIACATSVCGVSAAIAAAAASRAKKEELTLAVGMTMIFTVFMMMGIPAVCRLLELDLLLAGAWIGGTVDSTGAVVAAGALLGDTSAKVAAVIKMIQNVLIGIVAFLIALYWVSSVERDSHAPRPGLKEVWVRFPKFVLGFLGASVVFSFFLIPSMGTVAVEEILGVTRGFRSWFFCLAFAAIGLQSNFKELTRHLSGSKPVKLYIVGQTVNVLLTILAAWLAFGGILFERPVI